MKYKKQKSITEFEKQDIKKRFKMYKSKKRWVIAPILFLGLGGALVIEAPTVSAEETQTYEKQAPIENERSYNKEGEAKIETSDGILLPEENSSKVSEGTENDPKTPQEANVEAEHSSEPVVSMNEPQSDVVEGVDQELELSQNIGVLEVVTPEPVSPVHDGELTKIDAQNAKNSNSQGNLSKEDAKLAKEQINADEIKTNQQLNFSEKRSNVDDKNDNKLSRVKRADDTISNTTDSKDVKFQQLERPIKHKIDNNEFPSIKDNNSGLVIIKGEPDQQNAIPAEYAFYPKFIEGKTTVQIDGNDVNTIDINNNFVKHYVKVRNVGYLENSDPIDILITFQKEEFNGVEKIPDLNEQDETIISSFDDPNELFSVGGEKLALNVTMEFFNGKTGLPIEMSGYNTITDLDWTEYYIYDKNMIEKIIVPQSSLIKTKEHENNLYLIGVSDDITPTHDYQAVGAERGQAQILFKKSHTWKYHINIKSSASFNVSKSLLPIDFTSPIVVGDEEDANIKDDQLEYKVYVNIPYRDDKTGDKQQYSLDIKLPDAFRFKTLKIKDNAEKDISDKFLIGYNREKSIATVTPKDTSNDKYDLNIQTEVSANINDRKEAKKGYYDPIDIQYKVPITAELSLPKGTSKGEKKLFSNIATSVIELERSQNPTEVDFMTDPIDPTKGRLEGKVPNVPKGTQIVVTTPEGEEIQGETDSEGHFSIPIERGEEDIPVNVVANEKDKASSNPVETKVPKREHSATPTKVEFVADPSDPTKGKLEGKVSNVPEGTKVVATTPEGKELSGTTDPEGRFSIPVERKEEDTPVNMVVKEEGKVPSDPVTTQVPKQEHSATPTKVEFVADPSDPTKGRLEGKVENVPEGTQVVATTPEGKELSGTTDPEGRFNIPVERKEEDIPVNVVTKEEGKVPSDPVTTQVPKQEHSATPTKVEFVADPSDPTKGKLEGKVSNVPEGTKVVATTPEGEELSGTTDPEGRFSIPVERKEEDIPVNVVVKEEGKVPSDPAGTKVPKREHSATPTKVEFVADPNDPTKGRLEGKVSNVPEGTKVVATTPEGEELQGETDPEGRFSIPVERKEEDTPVNVVVKEEGKVPSDPVTTQVPKQEHSATPTKVEFVADPNDPTKGRLEGKVENVPEGTKVVATTPEGEELQGETDPEGRFSIPVERKEEDTPVNVVVKEKGKVPSDPVTTQVPKREHSATPTEVEFVADPSDPTKGRLEGKVSNVPEGTKVVATTPEGEELQGETDPEGRFSIPVERKEEDTPVNVVVKEEGKVPSDPVTTQVPKREHSATPTEVEFVADPSDPTKGRLEGKVENVPEGTQVVATTPEGKELSGTTDPEGRFSIPVERKEDIPVNVVTKEEGKVPSDPVTTQVPKQEHSATPTKVEFVADPSDPTKGKLEGKVENVPEGTKVVATTPEVEELSGTTDPEGRFSIPVERKEEDIPVNVVTKEEGKVPSDPAGTKVPKREHSATPTKVEFVADPSDPTKGKLEGEVENVPEGTKVVATTPEGEELSGTTDPEGRFSIPVERKEEDIPVNVVTKEEGKVPSDPVTTQVPKQEHSATPTKVEFVADPSDPTKGKLEGKVENVPEGTKVVATTPEVEELSGTTDPEGRFSIPVERKEEDIPVNVVTKEEGKVPSDPAGTKVPKREHSATPTKVEFVADPSDPTKGKLEGKVENVPEGTKVVATTPEGEELSGTTDPEGRFSIPVERKEEDIPVNVVTKEEGKVPSDPVTTQVPKQEHSATPTKVEFVADPSDPTKGKLEGKVSNVPEGTKVVATTPEGEELSGTTDPEGRFSIPVERKEEDTPVNVVVKEEGKVPSDPAETKVPKQEHSATPTEVTFVSDPSDPTKGRLEGKVENVPEGTKVVATTPEGEEIQGETDPTGHFSIPVERKEEDIPVQVVAKEEGKVPSDPAETKVPKQEHSATPTEVEFVSDSNDPTKGRLEGKVENVPEGTKVVAITPEGEEIQGETDPTGHFSIPVERGEEDIPVNVVVKEEGKVPSDPVSAIVSKVKRADNPELEKLSSSRKKNQSSKADGQIVKRELSQTSFKDKEKDLNNANNLEIVTGNTPTNDSSKNEKTNNHNSTNLISGRKELPKTGAQAHLEMSVIGTLLTGLSGVSLFGIKKEEKKMINTSSG